MLGYEETGFLLGVGDQMRRRARDAQAVVNQVAAERDAWRAKAFSNCKIANANYALLQQANARIADLEARLRR